MANFGFTRLTMNGRTMPAIIQLGARVLDDIIDSIEKSIKKVADDSTKRLTVNDITALTAAQLEALQCGDMVVKATGTMRHLYTVAYKDDTTHEISLVYCDAWNVEEVYYDKSVGGQWSCIETKVTAIATPATTE